MSHENLKAYIIIILLKCFFNFKSSSISILLRTVNFDSKIINKISPLIHSRAYLYELHNDLAVLIRSLIKKIKKI